MLNKVLCFFVLLLSKPIFADPQVNKQIDMKSVFKLLESKYQAKIGLYAIDTNSGKFIANRKNERFPFQSTFKFIGISSLLFHHQKKPILNQRITIKPKDVVPWGPISSQYILIKKLV